MECFQRVLAHTPSYLTSDWCIHSFASLLQEVLEAYSLFVMWANRRGVRRSEDNKKGRDTCYDVFYSLISLQLKLCGEGVRSCWLTLQVISYIILSESPILGLSRRWAEW